jgi:hypothetical protein
MYTLLLERTNGDKTPIGTILKTLRGAINQAHRLADKGNYQSGDIIRIHKISESQSPLDHLPVRCFTVR